MFKVSDLKYRTQNDFGFAIVSEDDLGFLPNASYFAMVNYSISTRLLNHAFGEILQAMWLDMAKFAILFRKSLEHMT